MTSGKARFNAPQPFEAPVDFSPKLRESLRSLYPSDQDQTIDSVFGHPGDQFVEVILSEARWVFGAMDSAKRSLTKEDVRAEQQSLLKTIDDLTMKLRSLSPDFDLLLDSNLDPTPRCLADILDSFADEVRRCDDRIARRGRKLRPDEAIHHIAREMAIRVLRAAEPYGIRPSATFDDSAYDYASPAIQLLRAIGDDVGIRLDGYTWRDIVIKLKQSKGRQ